ncbi:hypothetical protein [Streptomyces venezuelae]
MMRSLNGGRGLAVGVTVIASAMVASITPAVADSPASDAAKRATLYALLVKINMSEDPDKELIERLRKEFPEVAAGLEDPKRTEVAVKEAVITESGVAVSPETEKPLSAAELAEVEAPASAMPSTPSEEVETPEEGETDLPEVPAGGSAHETPDQAGAAVSGGRWKMTHITHTHRSYTGSIIFKYHTYARFNYKGGKVRAWGKRYDDFSMEADVVDTDARVTNVKSRVPASSATSMMKRKVRLCVLQYGCYAILYPWAKVKVYGSGRTKYVDSGA